jgi:endonuclease/exonuclease/phosphatase family metal-dependent hydrolase
MTYNIHKGFNWTQKKYLLSDMKDLVVASRAQIVCLQEVVGLNQGYKKKGFIDSQLEYFADMTWPHFSYAKNSVQASGHHGNSILSQFPITNWTQKNISTNMCEQRGILFSQIVVPTEYTGLPDVILNVLCVHLDLFSKGRSQQYEMIYNFVLGLNLLETDPLIIAGDFNDWNLKASSFFENKLNMTESYQHIHHKHAKTFPSFWPRLSLDRIYVKNLRVLNAEVLSSQIVHNPSDHLPMVINLEFN